MREDGKKYSLPTLHECVNENDLEKNRFAVPQLIKMSDRSGPIPVSYEDIRFFENKARSRTGLIGRRHTFTGKAVCKNFDGKVRSHSYNVQVSLISPCTF